jgi:hypothetical protein
LNITSATEFDAGDEFIIDPLLLPTFVAAAAAAWLLEEICVEQRKKLLKLKIQYSWKMPL